MIGVLNDLDVSAESAKLFHKFVFVLADNVSNNEASQGVCVCVGGGGVPVPLFP